MTFVRHNVLLVMLIFSNRYSPMTLMLLVILSALAPPVYSTGAAGLPRDDKAAASAASDGYRVQPGDILAISVWREPDLQGDILVRPDGGISFPLAGDVNATGMTIADVTAAVMERLKRYIPDPVVTVAVKTLGGNRVYVLGKVNRPGEFPFSRPLDVMQALALAGGATPFAALNDIKILRRTATQVTALEFRYGEVERGRALQQNILLQSGDTVVVP
jgi:polysaccharide export outer membrane protein